ncbi:MAG: Rpn family recombination-promoting nuclease/putative transposase [Boseongicola sp.]|nr:Rpn family recombination-promoting nuclease/putative transposase [Boseongicola sp.]
MSLPVMPHDALFRVLVSNPKRTAALLNDHLPPKIAPLVDREHPPVKLEGSFIDEKAARTQCDALFELRPRIGNPVRIYALLEHKSRPDAATPLQLAGYMLRIWRKKLKVRLGGLGSGKSTCRVAQRRAEPYRSPPRVSLLPSTKSSRRSQAPCCRSRALPLSSGGFPLSFS